MSVESSKNRYYEPKEFKEKIAVMSPLFKSYSANDAKDLVNFIIMTLHSELNKSVVNSKHNNLFSNEICDQRNKLETFQCFYKNYLKNFNSKISDVFYAIQQNQTTCLNCKAIQYNFQTYFFLIFPLEEAKKNSLANIYLNQMNQMNPMNQMNQMKQKLERLNNNIVNIFECFEYYQKTDIMSKDNAIFCNYCQVMSDAKYCTTLVTSPKILIILLNRGKGIEFNIKLEFYESLNLNSFIYMDNTNNNYKLIGVITHLGNSGEDGHFIAHCLSPINKKWYTYNDSIVYETKDFKKNIIDFGMPYLLFYQKEDKQ
jgi:ubiquitin C-terminal hydrolase